MTEPTGTAVTAIAPPPKDLRWSRASARRPIIPRNIDEVARIIMPSSWRAGPRQLQGAGR